MNRLKALGTLKGKSRLYYINESPVCTFQLEVKNHLDITTALSIDFIGNKAKDIYIQLVKGADMTVRGELRTVQAMRSRENYLYTKVLGIDVTMEDKTNNSFVKFLRGIQFDTIFFFKRNFSLPEK